MISYFPVVTGSLTVSGSVNISGGITASGGISISGSIDSASYASTASFVALAQSASNAVSAATASFANTLTVAGNLTAQTLVVQTITSSVDFVTGSTRFGSILDNTHVFTGSVSMNPGGLFVSSSGNVGIGTTSPINKLNVLVDGGGSDDGILIGVGSQGDGIKIVQRYLSNRVVATLGQSNYSGATDSGALRLYDVGGTETIRLSGKSSVNSFINSGNVGIGVTNPQASLHIIKALGNDAFAIGETSNNMRFRIGQEASYAGNYIQSTNIDLKLMSYLSGGTGGNIIFQTGASDIGSLATRMTINSSGNVTINNLVTSNRISFSLQSHGTKIVSDGNVSSSSFNLNTIFPEATNLIGGNVWGVFGKITIFRGGSAETGLFSLCRNGAGSWSSAAYATQTATGAYSLSNITGSGASITFTFNTAIYFIAEITVMAS